MHSTKDRNRTKLKKPTQHSGTKQDASVSLTAKTRCAVGFQEEADELGHALETWSDTTAQYWVGVGRKSQIPLSVKFATFRMKPVVGENFMLLGCVIFEGAT